MNPRELANKARADAAINYRQYANRYLQYGIAMYPMDAENACALWLDGMKALDAAEETEKGRTNAA